MKLSKKIIKSYIPEKFSDGSNLNGVSLEKNSYDLFCEIIGEEYILRTSSDNPLIAILSKIFEVRYVRHWFAHYSEYLIMSK